MRVILVEANGTISHLDLSNLPFCILKFGRFSQDLHVKNPRLFRIEISFHIYCVLNRQTANMLNEYFSSQSVVENHNTPLPPSNIIPHERLEIFETSPQAVKDVIDGLDTSKASGTDLLSPRLLKEGSAILAGPYSILYTSSLRLGHFPSP